MQVLTSVSKSEMTASRLIDLILEGVSARFIVESCLKEADVDHRRIVDKVFSGIDRLLKSINTSAEVRKYFEIPDSSPTDVWLTLKMGKFDPSLKGTMTIVFSASDKVGKFKVQSSDPSIVLPRMGIVFDLDLDSDGFLKGIRRCFRKNKQTFIHEFIHYLDYLRHKDKGAMSGTSHRRGEYYYNDPLEYNAHVQSFLSQYEDDIKDVIKEYSKEVVWEALANELGLSKDKRLYYKEMKSRLEFLEVWYSRLSTENQRKVWKRIEKNYEDFMDLAQRLIKRKRV